MVWDPRDLKFKYQHFAIWRTQSKCEDSSGTSGMGLWATEYERANWVELPLKKTNHIQSESDIFSMHAKEKLNISFIRSKLETWRI